MKNILGKTWIIGIMILFVGASVLPSISANIEEAGDITLKQELAHTDITWSEDFDSYDDGSSMHGQGGWEGWENDPTWTAYVTSDQSQSSPNSVDILPSSDLIHQFEGYTAGCWRITAWR